MARCMAIDGSSWASTRYSCSTLSDMSRAADEQLVAEAEEANFPEKGWQVNHCLGRQRSPCQEFKFFIVKRIHEFNHDAGKNDRKCWHSKEISQKVTSRRGCYCLKCRFNGQWLNVNLFQYNTSLMVVFVQLDFERGGGLYFFYKVYNQITLKRF